MAKEIEYERQEAIKIPSALDVLNVVCLDLVGGISEMVEDEPPAEEIAPEIQWHRACEVRISQ